MLGETVGRHLDILGFRLSILDIQNPAPLLQRFWRMFEQDITKYTGSWNGHIFIGISSFPKSGKLKLRLSRGIS